MKKLDNVSGQMGGAGSRLFAAFLRTRGGIAERKIPFMVHWVTLLLEFAKARPELQADDDVEAFLADLSHERPVWQVEQAREACRLYLYFRQQEGGGPVLPGPEATPGSEVEAQRRHLHQEMVRVLRLQHRSVKTERTYCWWLGRFWVFSVRECPRSWAARTSSGTSAFLPSTNTCPHRRRTRHSALSSSFSATWCGRMSAGSEMRCGPPDAVECRSCSTRGKFEMCWL